MALTWKDIVATAALLIVLLISYALLRGLDWPLLINWRAGTLALLVVGLATCIFMGSGGVPEKGAWTTVATVLGITAFALIIGGIIFNSKWLFILLAANIVALYILSTTHHLIGKGA